MENKNKNTFQ